MGKTKIKMQDINCMEKTQGITLIVLVITVIVLLILARCNHQSGNR